MPNKPNHQRKLINEAKLRVRGIGKQIADLRYEKRVLDQYIRQAEFIADIRKQQRTDKWMAKLKKGQKHKRYKNILKATLDGVRQTEVQ